MEISIMDIGAIGNSALLSQVNAELKSSALPKSSVEASTTAQKEVKKESPQGSTEQIKKAVDEINQSMKQLSRGLEFAIDDDTKLSVVKVIDSQTKEIIRQFPSQETLQIAKSLDLVLGKIIKDQA
jgi:flagellar protein FlaG